jgi:hypothetical protein
LFSSKNDLHKYLKEHGVLYRNNKFIYNSIIENKSLYLLSLLANFGHSGYTDQTDSLVKDLVINKVYEDEKYINYKEQITLFYGMRNGYNGFSKNYFFDDKIFSLKFQLDNNIDYYTLESIYQSVFNNKVSFSFDFLNCVLPNSTKIVDNKKYKTYKLLDSEVIYGTKPKSFDELLRNIFKIHFPKSILKALTESWSKKNSINLSDSQQVIIDENYYSIIKNPTEDYVRNISSEIRIFYEEIINEQEEKVKNLLIEIEETRKLNDAFKSKIAEFEENQKQLNLNKKNTYKIIVENEETKNSINDVDLEMNNKKQIKIDSLGVVDLHKFYLPKVTIAELKKIATGKNVFIKGISVEKIIEEVLEQISKEYDSV